jgi:hypothetical protein
VRMLELLLPCGACSSAAEGVVTHATPEIHVAKTTGMAVYAPFCV